eukprot:203824-Ditylum_brightwellii.AAC.1
MKMFMRQINVGHGGESGLGTCHQLDLDAIAALLLQNNKIFGEKREILTAKSFIERNVTVNSKVIIGKEEKPLKYRTLGVYDKFSNKWCLDDTSYGNE